MDKKIIVIGSVVIVAVILVLGVFLQRGESKTAKSFDIISQSGLHWHADLSIIVNGKPVEVPPNIGISTTHNPIHTHDGESNVIHMEFPALVRKDDLMLGEFFKVWKKDIRSFGTNIKMTVNGKDNTEFENYHMKDGDKIVLSFD